MNVLDTQKKLLENINQFVEDEIRPMLLGDGGDLQVSSLSEDGILQLKVEGNCVHCASLPMTMTFAIENRLKEKFPEIKAVVQEKEESA
jgi:Fe-S cluster biogenesis protein NfuA